MTMLALLLACGALGALVGVAYFATLGWNVRFYFRERRGWAAVATHVARFVVVMLCFAAIARGAGAGALLSAFAGFLVVRTVAIRRVQRRIEEAV